MHPHGKKSENERIQFTSISRGTVQYHLVVFLRLILLVLLFFELSLRREVGEVDITLRLFLCNQCV